MGEGITRVMLYSPTNEVLSGSSGEVMQLSAKLSGSVSTKYNLSIANAILTTATGDDVPTICNAGSITTLNTSTGRTYNGRTWMVGNYAPIRYDFASINAAMASSQVKDGDILLVFDSTVSGDQTVSKRVKIVGQKIYEKWNETQIQNLYIEAPQVTLDYIRVAKDIVVRDNDALIEHCYVSGSVVSGLNWECDNAVINSCYVYGNVDDSNGYDWTVTNNYIQAQQTGYPSGYSEYPSDLPRFTEFDRWTQTTVSQGEPVPVNYIISGIDSPKLVEYFWDSDPGWTKGSALKNANNNYIANTWNEGLTISTNGLSVGKHTLVVRVCSNSGYWAVATRGVTVEQPVVTDPTPVFSLVDFPTSGVNTDYKISFVVAAEGGLIDWVEYYWDNDPGQKNGHCIVDGGHDAGQGITRYNYSIDCGGLTGSHTLYLRAFCGSKSTVVYVKEIKLTAPSIDYINADDLAALKLISDNLGLGGYWNFANNGRYESDFPGVTFLNHRVIEINLANRGLTGTLSTSWMPSLPELTLLNLSRNNIYGDITPLVAKMPKLKTLNVSYNRITQVSGLLPATLTTFNAASQMRTANPAVTPSSENFINPLVSGSLTPTTAPVGQAVSLALPSLFYYDADKNDNSLRADIQVVDVNKPETVYGTYSYNGANSGWKFTPQQTSISLENKKFVALVTRGKWQQWSACPAQLSVLLGDANIDGTVDVLDVQHTLNYILATAQPFNYWAANTYTDQIINVQDIVCTVNIMLGLPNNARRSDRARSLDRRADDAADASCWVYEQNGRIALTSADDIAAIDIEVEGASTDEVSLLLRHKDFSMIGQNTATGSRYVIFSTTGATIPAGTGAAVLALSHSAVPVAIRCADTTAREVKAAIGTPTGISEVRSAADGKTVIETRLAPGVYIVRTIEADGTGKTVKVLKK